MDLFKPVGFQHTSGMPEPVAPMVVILLVLTVGLLVLLMGMMWGLSRRLVRIERHLAEGLTRQAAAEAAPSPAEIAVGGAFETFLNEDPTRRTLPKGEQFAAYRQWRQDKGLNWSNS